MGIGKGNLEENYAVRRTLDYYACKMFSARQEKNESVASWGNVVLKTAGTVELKLLTATHETSHLFHVLEETSALQCDGILGKDFLEEKREHN